MMKFPSNVGDAMSSPVITVDEETNVRDSAMLMADKGIGSLIVLGDGKPVGIVTKRDMIKRVVSECKDPCGTKIRDIMASPVITTSKDVGILSAMRTMREHQISQLLVLDGDRMVGVISERDLIKAVSYASLASFTPLMRGKK
jgi:CBS domain-containing protein